MRQFSFSAEAEEDISSALIYYHSLLAGLEERFLKEVDVTLRYIALHPGGFQRIRRDFRQAPLERFPYVIVYSFDQHRIEVVRVFNTKQQPRKKLRRRSTGS
ncbi:MAG TPA: type II toxin-antitoxin system RelE/ParE family toxin [Flavobacteriales bacterium]|nr:type II toxin-antitoxin system RelE/ParE family toxin [Flavobacteriales bacterium]